MYNGLEYHQGVWKGTSNNLPQHLEYFVEVDLRAPSFPYCLLSTRIRKRLKKVWPDH
eukprot:Gb_41728 [translate_table: standard]